MSKQASVASSNESDSCLVKLAEFFPGAISVRIPVLVARVGAGTPSGEQTVIEFGTPDTVLFASTLPLDFEDRLRLENSDGSLNIEAEVVAVQLDGAKTAVAARFRGNVPNWIIKG
ncbi:MAG TPA: hypothetical protein VN176_06270 [Verrucomicrobiae bacterium]|nr:hypothetical protein [Verrucomicrobiae bacterium]